MKKELIINNDLMEIHKVTDFIAEIGETLRLRHDVVTKVNLAIEEAVVNIIRYAYPPPEKNEISLYASFTNKELTFLLTDSGIPFDPTKFDDVDVTLSIEERQVGGLGIMLIRKIMNEVTYNRIDGENRLILKRKL
ncbi:MAG: ATP-binding protein [Muribaculaceae bacterium]